MGVSESSKQKAELPDIKAASSELLEPRWSIVSFDKREALGLTAGSKAEFDLGLALSKRLTITGTVLRARPSKEKAEVTREFESNVVPLFVDGTLKANIDRVFPYEEVREAHEYLESNESFGKVVLEF